MSAIEHNPSQYPRTIRPLSPLSNPEELYWLDSVSQAFRNVHQADDFHPDWLHNEKLHPAGHLLMPEGDSLLANQDFGLTVGELVPAPFSHLYTWLGDAVSWTCGVVGVGDAPVARRTDCGPASEQKNSVNERAPRLVRIDSRRSLNEVNLDGQPFRSSRNSSLTDLVGHGANEDSVAGLVYEMYGAWR